MVRVIGEILGSLEQTQLTACANHHLEYYKAIFEAMNISAAKNHDYSGGENSDPLRNFKKSEQAGIPAEIGLMVRMQDKISRIETFVEKGELQVKGESVRDALIDLANYCFLFCALLEDKKQ